MAVRLSIKQFNKLTETGRPNKHNNKKASFQNRVFDSTWERDCYRDYLYPRILANEIINFEFQKQIKLEAYGVTICSYYADFYYYDTIISKTVVYEAKGFEEDVFKLKWPWARAKYPDFLFILHFKKDGVFYNDEYKKRKSRTRPKSYRKR